MIGYLSLGSNLRSPYRQIRQALELIKGIPRTRVTQCSDLYFNPAIGRRSQPPFCNVVIEIHTSLSPNRLLNYCLTLEKKQQRIRKVRWAARTLDIDILLLGDWKINQQHLIVPHPRMHERDFVLKPLQQLLSKRTNIGFSKNLGLN
jgi:2-amino-4-hydroxy-6-hydroxymethyldihydropteridine diphosphokinase